MEILFRNKRRTAKLCMKVSCDDVWHFNENELDMLKGIIAMNEGYTWEPVRTGFARDNNLPLIGA